MDGIMVINKPGNYTSFDVVAVMRKLLKTKKIGHAGTLDPMATGVLPILAGNATKIQNLLQGSSKEYRAKFRLGLITDTEDTSGKILKKNPVNVNVETLKKVISAFVGEIKQVPPMYSAIKKDGVRLYSLARQGIEVSRENRVVTIDDIKLENYNEEMQEATMRVRCSKGTYIRTLCADIGNQLGCGATMSKLERTRVDSFTLEKSITLDRAKELASENKLDKLLLSIDSVLSKYNAVKVTDAQTVRFLNGGGLALDRMSIKDVQDSQKLRVYGTDGKLLGLGIVTVAKKEMSVYKLLYTK